MHRFGHLVSMPVEHQAQKPTNALDTPSEDISLRLDLYKPGDGVFKDRLFASPKLCILLGFPASYLYL
jgi:hypothetical protein